MVHAESDRCSPSTISYVDVNIDCLQAQDLFVSAVMQGYWCCRYEFVTGNGLHAVMAAAASKGQVYVAGGTASSAQWQVAGPALRQAVQSFKLN